ncbi:hypothetical protein M413DRAFT_114305 [Hebeloma cylindrosporum]|uniref:BTB domain-containing protein n=1 Tax=Hebeloma cylindrosporum TaxID=76867 RepID=A0A0C2YIV6_HEBCY|nr:hypothetical protein M413DRAFT_114305 [Hebeloma cylindrosporum h7]
MKLNWSLQKSKSSRMSQATPEHPLKRTEEPLTKDNDQPPPFQSALYWFDDGNVILQIETKQYRVHRSLLSRHSKVFKDMFSLPQPAMDPGPITSDGCPVIFLCDKATDLEHALSVIYDNIR